MPVPTPVQESTDEVAQYGSDREAFSDIFEEGAEEEDQETAKPGAESEEEESDPEEEAEESEEEEGDPEGDDLEEDADDESEDKPEEKRGDPQVPLKHLRAENKQLKAAQAESNQQIAELRAMVLHLSGDDKSPEIQKIIADQTDRDMRSAVSILPSLPTDNALADMVEGLHSRGYTYTTAAQMVRDRIEKQNQKEKVTARKEARQEIAKKQSKNPPSKAVPPSTNDSLKKRSNSPHRTTRERALAEDLGFI